MPQLSISPYREKYRRREISKLHFKGHASSVENMVSLKSKETLQDLRDCIKSLKLQIKRARKKIRFSSSLYSIELNNHHPQIKPSRGKIIALCKAPDEKPRRR